MGANVSLPRWFQERFGEDHPEPIILDNIEPSTSNVFTPLNDSEINILQFALNGEDANFWNLIKEDDSLIKTVDEDGDTVLHKACIKPDAVELAKKIAKKYPYLEHATNFKGYKPIHTAAYNGNGYAFWVFINKNASLIDAVDTENGDTVLHKACCTSNKDAVDLAIQVVEKFSYLIHETNNEGRKPIHTAAYNGNSDLVWYLMSKDKSLIDAVDNFGIKAIHCAFIGGCTDIVMHLLKKVKDDEEYFSKYLWYQDKLKKTLLHYAVKVDDTHLLDVICSELEVSHANNSHKYRKHFKLDKDSPYLDMEDSAGNTPLHCAIQEFNKATFDNAVYLIKQNANLQHKNKSGQTPFLIACKFCKLDLIKFLVEQKNVVVTDRDNLGNSGLHLSTFSEHCYTEACVRYLMTLKGHSFNDENNEKLNVALYSIENNNQKFLSEFMQDLLECDGLQTSQHMNIFHMLAKSKYDTNMSDLLKKHIPAQTHADFLNTRIIDGDFKGYLPIHIAFRSSLGIKIAMRDWNVNKKQIYKETFERENCIEIACNNISFSELHQIFMKLTEENATRMHWLEILRLVDNVRHAFPKQSEQDAQDILLPFCDSDLKSEISNKLNIPKHTREDNKTMIHVFTKFTRLLKIVLSAKSAELFRSYIFCFHYENSISVVSDLFKCLQQEIQRDKIKCKNFFEIKNENDKKFSTYGEIKNKIGFSKLCQDEIKLQNYENNFVNSLLEIALNESEIDDYNLAKDMLLCEHFNLLPSALRVMIWVNQIDNKTKALIDLNNFAANLAINTINFLYKTIVNDKKKHNLFFNYLDGKCGSVNDSTFSLFYNIHKSNDKNVHQQIDTNKSYSVYQLIRLTENEDLLATECMEQFVDKRWTNTIKIKFYFHFAMYILMMFLIGFYQIYITYKRKKELHFDFFDATIIIFVVSYFLQEIYEYKLAKTNYFKDLYNWFDMLGLYVMLIAIVYKQFLNVYAIIDDDNDSNSYDVAHPLQIMFAIAFLWFSLRLLAFFRYFQNVGLYIGTFFKLLHTDMIPFIAVFATFILGFGMFAFTLLNPGSNKIDYNNNEGRVDIETDSRLLFKIVSRPMYVYFGQPEDDKTMSCGYKFQTDHISSELNKTINNEDEKPPKDCVFPFGAEFYYYCFQWLFMLLVSTPLMNMLIAKFSMTVADDKERAKIIARSYNLSMLREFSKKHYCPPPFFIFEFLFMFFKKKKIIQKIIQQETQVTSKKLEEENIYAYNDNDEFSEYSQDYKDFLWWQTLTLRKKRAELTVDVKENGSSQEKLETQIKNSKLELLNDSNVLQKDVSQLKKDMSHLQKVMQSELHDVKQMLEMLLKEKSQIMIKK